MFYACVHQRVSSMGEIQLLLFDDGVDDDLNDDVSVDENCECRCGCVCGKDCDDEYG